MIEIPIRFPSQREVIDEEVARFRALSHDGRIKALAECFALYHALPEQSSHADRLRRLAQEEEARAASALRAFAARHA